MKLFSKGSAGTPADTAAAAPQSVDDRLREIRATREAEQRKFYARCLHRMASVTTLADVELEQLDRAMLDLRIDNQQFEQDRRIVQEQVKLGIPLRCELGPLQLASEKAEKLFEEHHAKALESYARDADLQTAMQNAKTALQCHRAEISRLDEARRRRPDLFEGV